MSGYSDYIVPLISLAVIVAGIIKKTDIFDAFEMCIRDRIGARCSG